MKLKMSLMIAMIGLINGLSAQVTTGTISGYVFESDSATIIPFAKLWVETESGKRYTKADLDGKYKIDALKPGVYNLTATAMNFDTLTIAEIRVNPDGITTVNMPVPVDSKVLGPVIIVYTPPMINKDTPRLLIDVQDIENSPYVRDPKGLLVGTSSEVNQVEGTSDIIIRGSRPGDAIFYIDGVKANDMTSVPGVAIQGLEAYTGGIPAKYGDTTGGVVVLETKSYFDLYYAWKARQ
jgi:hypothetical protein